ncbi:uncharacterized protein LOC142175758 [Nicotiana tabacum]|uniref:Uncharacterized protein LOC142175758 n=1 Tax=Nicotiana tabacum TaxID=4097 RepID=A0AC58TNP5_TOBAC
MSDKQKGLIEAFNEVLPSISRRFFVRHLRNNFKRASFSGISLKHALWTVAGATTVRIFDARMEDIAKLDAKAATCMILDARDKPIITLLKKLRYLLMARLQANRDKGDRWNCGDICPRIRSSLHKNEKVVAAFIPKKSNEWNYEIFGGSVSDIWAVNLAGRKCSCWKWTITEIPYKHAISAIWDKNDEVINYVDDCYKVKTYKRIYAPAILPINDSQLWTKSDKVRHLPPRFLRQNKKGRKQKLRREEQDEVGSSRTKMKKKQTSIVCGLCHKPDHNRRTCKFNYVQLEVGVFEPTCWMPATSFVLPLMGSMHISDDGRYVADLFVDGVVTDLK